ncbi:hypothetical protein Pan265_23000 [Mucisphaera calidilacus]|uniref:DUF58 domain-containing protein n=2 Tax=Mucisphaera calidilacus TaxID=2527982 RepID=A0A518BZN9_9BACT|nr:hypothetical protein Pan265_23000 [Mucisphaera calidilacus]
MPQVSYRWSLTPAGWSYIAATVMVTTSTMLSQANLLFFLTGLLWGALLIDAAWSALGLWGLTVRRWEPSRAIQGEHTPIRYVITRGGLLPMGVVVVREGGVSMPQEAGCVMFLGRRARATTEGVLDPDRRGLLRLATICVRSSFPFGLTRAERRFARVGEILVYPRVYRVDKPLRATSGLWREGGKAELRGVGSGGDFAGLREYRPGDAVRTIDWKRTAKTGKLMVREHTRPVPPRVMLALDVVSGSPNEEECERAIMLAASMVCAAYDHGMPMGLVLVGAEGRVHRPHLSVPHRDQILDTLARMEPGVGGEARRAQQLRPSIWLLASAQGVAPHVPDLLALYGADASRLLDMSVSAMPLDPREASVIRELHGDAA